MSIFKGLFSETIGILRGKVQVPAFSPSKPLEIWVPATEEAMRTWFCRTDKDIGGKSEASLEFHPEGHAVFRGKLSTELPVDSRVKRSGFCLLRSKLKKPTLFGKSLHDLTQYNGLELTVRGDGRAYIINIRTDGYQPDDIFQAFLYTKGGPEWQTVQVPFSEFLLTNMGYVQNEQTLLNKSSILNFALLLADRVDGSFSIDLKSIRAISMNKELGNMDVENS